MSTENSACRCGHGQAAHEHYRRGSDCGVCGPRSCRSFALDTRVVTVAATVEPPLAGVAS